MPGSVLLKRPSELVSRLIHIVSIEVDVLHLPIAPSVPSSDSSEPMGLSMTRALILLASHCFFPRDPFGCRDPFGAGTIPVTTHPRGSFLPQDDPVLPSRRHPRNACESHDAIHLPPFHPVHRNSLLTLVIALPAWPRRNGRSRVRRPIQTTLLPPKNSRERRTPLIRAASITRLCNHPTTGKYIACAPLDSGRILEAGGTLALGTIGRRVPFAMLFACTASRPLGGLCWFSVIPPAAHSGRIVLVLISLPPHLPRPASQVFALSR